MGAVPSRSRDPLLPVESLTAADAEAFCARLGALLPGCAARLPGEAEWELAMRAGAAGPFGSIPPAQASAAIAHHGLGLADPRPAGSGPPNPIGLRDGPGNLWEWCAGAYGPQPTGSPAVDPRPADGPLRVARGGSWGDGLLSSRLARRLALPATARSCYLGFRFVVEDGP
ncbi:MAG: formylglycine-generating enzyme family protein [Planctomycetes bacterium]|nr:formylglycine-generating enzyme family protein [Planctomycetota bacterium]